MDHDEKRSARGLSLSREFYRTTMAGRLADIPHAAGLIGDGSEVLGFDTEMSGDHDYGPRVVILADDLAAVQERVGGGVLPGPSARLQCPVHTVAGFLSAHLDHDGRTPPTVAEWLTFSQQKLATLVGGEIFHDDIGLQSVREAFTWYPHDVWLYLLACGWARIGQEEHLMGRAGSVGDELGASLVTSRLVRDAMRLCFLMERRYAPYPKWFGSAFVHLASAPPLLPLLRQAQLAPAWQEAEDALCQVWEHLVAQLDRLAVAPPQEARVHLFHDRPFRIIGGQDIARSLLDQIGDAEVRRLAALRPIGSIDQWSDSTDLICGPEWRPALRALYDKSGHKLFIE